MRYDDRNTARRSEKMNEENIKRHQFKPGQSGNPRGSRPLPKVLSKIRGDFRLELARTILEVFGMKFGELMPIMDALSNYPNVPLPDEIKSLTPMQVTCMTFMAKATGGSVDHLKALLEHIIGKGPLQAPLKEDDFSPIDPETGQKKLSEFDESTTAAILRELRIIGKLPPTIETTCSSQVDKIHPNNTDPETSGLSSS